MVAKNRALSAALLLGLLHLLAERVGCQTETPLPTTTPTEPEDEPAPPFPELVNWNEKRLKIVSEIIEAEQSVGSQTQEEYLDLSAGRAAFVLTNKLGYRVKFVDADEGLAFTYRPYKCHVQRLSDISDELQVVDLLARAADTAGQEPVAGANWVWNYNSRLKASRDGAHELRLFGVSALWFEASDKPKVFERAQIIYSAAKNIYRQSLLWTYHDDRHNLNIKFYFIQHQPSQASGSGSGSRGLGGLEAEPALEMIKIEQGAPPGASEPKLLRTINILSIEHALPEADESRANLLSVPLGFGCFSGISDDFWAASSEASLADEVRRRRSHANLNGPRGDSLWEGHAELEITATKYEYDEQQLQSHQASGAGAASARLSDTYSVELAQSSVHGYGLTDAQTHVKLVRWRNTRDDRKLLLHHTFQVRFEIDMRRGTCEMSHLASGARPEDEPLGAVEAPIVFKNGLQFDANVDLFADSEDLHFIKQSAGGYDKRGLALHYYEGTAGSDELRGWLALASGSVPASRTRVMRAYEAHEYETGSAGELRSVTIWLLNADESRIEQSYQIYVVSARSLEPTGQWLEKAKLFDVSRECFLENERMLQNRDYAWITRTYPAPARLLEVIANNQREMKEIYYAKFMSDFTRAPRVEILMEEDSFKIRSLLLDMPGVDLLYDRTPGVMLEPAYAAGDLDFMAPDLAHCAHLCQLNQCTVMSFCPGAHTCFVSPRRVHSASAPSQAPAQTKGPLNFVAMKGCDAYKITWRMETSQLHRLGRLVNVIAKFRHQEYGPAPADMPVVPDEVSLPLEESRLSFEERRAAVSDYMAKLSEWMRDNNRLPSSAFALELADHLYLLLPSKFELEEDPLDEFSLHELTSGGGSSARELAQLDGGYGAVDSQRTPVFHRGLAMWRFNPARAASLPKDEAARVHFQTMRGLSYDQCALACWDSKCGSFSHCTQTLECVLSSVNSSALALNLKLVDEDSDCFVAQRDFLGNFVKFENVFRPQAYMSSQLVSGSDPSQCALNCVARTDFRCLAFEFCRDQSDATGGGRCFYQTERHSNEGATAAALQTPTKQTGCDHYARSALADFLRLDSRRMQPRVLEQLKTSEFRGVSVFDCADKCAAELVDCTGFQYCQSYEHRPDTPPTALGPAPVRQCLTIESKVSASMLSENTSSSSSSSPPPSSGDESKPNGDNSDETLVDERADGEIVHAGRYLKFDIDCQVFTMREDTAEAHLRELAFGGLVRTTSDKEAASARAANARGRLTLLSGFLLYLAVVVLSASLVCLMILARDNSELLRQRWDRLRLLAGF